MGDDDEMKDKKGKKEKKEKRDRRVPGTEEEAPAAEEEEQQPRKSAKKRKERATERVEGEEAPADSDAPAEGGVGSGKIKDLWKNGEQAWRDGTLEAEYLQRNPDGITRLFCGNLKLDITEEALRAHIPNITYIRWQKDKTTKEFYGSTFLEMKDAKAAALAVGMDRTKFMGRPLKIYYCPPRPGDTWPPTDANSANSAKGSVSSGKDRFSKPKTPKPPQGRKLYMGNLSFDVDDETIVEFFKVRSPLLMPLKNSSFIPLSSLTHTTLPRTPGLRRDARLALAGERRHGRIPRGRLCGIHHERGGRQGDAAGR